MSDATSEQESGGAYTPGPWRVKPQRVNFSVVAANGDYIVDCVRGSKSQQITHNARLIAASPRMYEFIAKRAEQGDADAASIIAAIAKATGAA